MPSESHPLNGPRLSQSVGLRAKLGLGQAPARAPGQATRHNRVSSLGLHNEGPRYRQVSTNEHLPSQRPRPGVWGQLI